MEKILIFLTLLATGVAAIYDLKTKKIPNILTYPLIFLGLILNAYFFGYAGLKDSLFGLLVPSLILLIPFALGGIGAGDVKIMAGIGAMCGLHFGIYTLLYSSVYGGLLALGILLYRKQLQPVLFNVVCSLPFISMNILNRKGVASDFILLSGLKFPYGLAIFLGTLTTYIIR